MDLAVAQDTHKAVAEYDEEKNESSELEENAKLRAWAGRLNLSKRQLGEVDGESEYDIPQPSPMKHAKVFRDVCG